MNNNPVQTIGKIIGVRKTGFYSVISIACAGIAETARPGQFVTVAVGGENSSMLLRRAFSIASVDDRSSYGGVIDIVVSAEGPGTRWLASRKRDDSLDLVGPLGKPYPIPKNPVATVLVGGGYGAANLPWLGKVLIQRGCRLDSIYGAATDLKVYGQLEARRIGGSLTITTEDGSLGTMGRVTDVLPDVMSKHNAAVVYACGPMPMLSAVAQIAQDNGAIAQVAVEEAMACGIGVCMTCVLPIIDENGITKMTRSCISGPVFDAAQVRFADINKLPSDVYGADAMGGH
ncbi:MAG: dihydroorotate dehydrogenase electron transfer subunit [Actinobacteria bacterium]|nr:dihydroorotate dehydrogenase electron transfer subunit [Actinomycetota bacterium]